MNNELIVLEQLPKIKYQLKQLSTEIKEKVDRVNSLIVNEDTVKETKQLRADLNKEFNELETQRKKVKQAIMSKYDEFEEVYKECVSNLYKDADAQLKSKIDEVEYNLKIEKENELRDFFKQYQVNYHLEDMVDFENVGLNITLSASMKSLKEQIVEYCERINNDIQIINNEEDRDELLLEYKNNGYDYQKAKLVLIQRKKQLEEIKQKQEQVEEVKSQEVKVEENVATIVAPKEIIEDDEFLEVTFTVKAHKEKIIKLKEFMKEENIVYE